MSGWMMGVEIAHKKIQLYPEVVGNHLLYCHSVDDQNNNERHSPISLLGCFLGNKILAQSSLCIPAEHH